MKCLHTDLAYDFIRERIVSGEYAPGQALLMESLALEIHVSRTPIRDALRKLETDGLVTILARAGASVREMTSRELRELFDLRLALESHAAGLAAAKRAARHLTNLRMLLEEQESRSGKKRSGELERAHAQNRVDGDLRFHPVVVEASQNDLLAKEIARLHLISEVFGCLSCNDAMHPEDELAAQVDTEIAAHHEIFRAITLRNVAAAKAAMGEHLQAIIDRRFNPRVRAFTAEELACLC
jgi:DNA-binding GntR family transcriptional regulator